MSRTIPHWSGQKLGGKKFDLEILVSRMLGERVGCRGLGRWPIGSPNLFQARSLPLENRLGPAESPKPTCHSMSLHFLNSSCSSLSSFLIRQTVPCRAIRCNSISVNAILSPRRSCRLPPPFAPRPRRATAPPRRGAKESRRRKGRGRVGRGLAAGLLTPLHSGATQSCRAPQRDCQIGGAWIDRRAGRRPDARTNVGTG